MAPLTQRLPIALRIPERRVIASMRPDVVHDLGELVTPHAERMPGDIGSASPSPLRRVVERPHSRISPRVLLTSLLALVCDAT